MTPQTIARAMSIPVVRAIEWAEPLNTVMESYIINTPQRQAAFLAQIGHETRGLTKLVEDMNYSATRLMEVWPKRFQNALRATLYAHNPEKLANYVYADRMGNGNEATGDGWRFRGRGAAMLTGRANYMQFGESCGMNNRYVQFPDHVAEDKLSAIASAGWFWYSRSLSDYADRGDYEGISKRWNGGDIGMEERIARTESALEALA